MLTEKGNLCACAQRFMFNEHNKEEGALKNNVATSSHSLFEMLHVVKP